MSHFLKPKLPLLESSSHGQTKPKLLSREKAAEFLGLKSQTLAAWLTNKRYNLPIVKIGSRVFYRESDLIAFIESNVICDTSNSFNNKR